MTLVPFFSLHEADDETPAASTTLQLMSNIDVDDPNRFEEAAVSAEYGMTVTLFHRRHAVNNTKRRPSRTTSIPR